MKRSIPRAPCPRRSIALVWVLSITFFFASAAATADQPSRDAFVIDNADPGTSFTGD